MTFGHLTLPAIEFVPPFLSNMAQHRGVLTAWVMQNEATRQPASTPAGEAGELSEDELLRVAGGAVTQTTTVSNGIVITGKYGTPSPIFQQTQAGLGSLLGSGAGGYGAVGLVGSASMLIGIWGAGLASLLGASGAGTAFTVGMAFTAFFLRF